MATYTYKCSDCGEVFDIEATIKEKEEGRSEKFACPKCRSKNIKQEFSAFNFIKNVFKGDKKSGGCCSEGKNCCGEGQSEEKEPDCCGHDHGRGCC